MLRARLYADYMDPGSFLVEERLRAVEDAVAFRVERLPWEVVPQPTPLLDPRDPAWSEYWAAMARELAADGHEIVPPRLIPWTAKAHELAMLAREKGCFDKVHQTLFRAFHLEGADLGRVDVLVALAMEAGLDLSETKAVLDVDRFAPELEAVRREGEALGVRGVPTLVLGDEVFEGIHDRVALETLLSRFDSK